MKRDAFSERIYSLLLWLYPADFRRHFGLDMRELFRDRLRASSAQGTGAMASLWLSVLTDLLNSALRERAAGTLAWLTARAIPDTPNCTPTRTGDSMLDTLWQDLRFATRLLRKTPTFTAVAVIVIALGSGAMTTIFSATNALVLRPLPGVEQPSRLMDVSRVPAKGNGSLTPSYPYYAYLRDHAHAMDGIAAWSMLELTVSNGGEGISTFGNIVSGNFFTVLGVRPEIGRFFAAEEDRVPGANPVVVLSDAYWRSHFGGDSAVVGKSISVNGAPYTVIGVAPRGFRGVFPVARTDVWVPLMMAGPLGRVQNILTSTGSGWLMLVGRLRDGVSVSTAHADLERVSSAYTVNDPETFKKFTSVKLTRVSGFPADATGAVFGFIGLLFAVSVLVLLIACVNVASMLLARAVTRRHEMAVRLAMGAGRARLIRQMLTESVALFLMGGMGGLLISEMGTKLFDRIQFPAEVPIVVDLSPDYRVLLFSLGTALVTGILFGLAPAFQGTRSALGTRLRGDTAAAGERRSRVRSALVIGQMSLSLLLLMSAGLFVRALDRGEHVSPGFDSGNIATAPYDVTTSGYSEQRARVFYDLLQQRVAETPGVTGVSYSRMIPLQMSRSSTSMKIDGYETPAATSRDGTESVDFNQVGAGYFSVVRMPILSGREFNAGDIASAPHVAVINEEFAKHYWPGTQAIGRTFQIDKDVFTVVGVARNAKYSVLNEDLLPFAYVPMTQLWQARTNLLVRTAGDPAALAPVIRQIIHSIDPMLPPPDVITMQAATSVALLPQRVAAGVTAALGAIGLLLAATGLYGVVSYSVSQRTREIGVRMALGAARSDVLRLIIRDGMRLTLIGVALGMVMAAGLTRVLSSFLFGVSPLDPLTFIAIPLLLSGIAFAASYLPARRAAAADPLSALRSG